MDTILKPAQKRIVIAALTLISVVNVISASGLSSISNSVQHPIGPSYVSVYIIGKEAALSVVPVQRVTSNAFLDTGQRVSVYLRNDYCSADGWTAPKLTLLIIAFSILFYLYAGRKRTGMQS